MMMKFLLVLGLAFAVCNASPVEAEERLESKQLYVPPPFSMRARLSGGTNAEGRLEVLVSGVWKSVCDDAFDHLEATVACRQMGFPLGGEVVPSAHAYYGYGEQQVWLDELQCHGSEQNLEQCPHLGLGIHDCDGRTETAGVRCITSPTAPRPGLPVPPYTPSYATPVASVRLSGGAHAYEGKVEVNVMGQWRSVCADHFESVDATVVCRMLGLQSGSIVTNAYLRFGYGIPEVWMDDVQCFGHENSLAECSHRGYGVANCNGANQVAGVECAHAPVPLPPYVPSIPSIPSLPVPASSLPVAARLSGGAHAYEGKVEVNVMGQWRSVCADHFEAVDASVVCRMLGLSSGNIVTNAYQRFGYGIREAWMDDVQCRGNEYSLSECAHRGYGIVNCDGTTQVAGVVCDGAPSIPLPPYFPAPPSNIPITAAISASLYQDGIALIHRANEMSFVCADTVHSAEATVICKMINPTYTRGDAIAPDQYTSISGIYTMMKDLQCMGHETNVAHCYNKKIIAINSEPCITGKAKITCSYY